MKKIITTLLVFAISFSIAQTKNKTSNFKKKLGVSNTKLTEKKLGGGMEDDALQRMKWELKRLADPLTGKIPENIRAKELAFVQTLPNDAYVDQKNLNEKTNNNVVWTNRGPWNVGGTTRAFGIDAANENRLLAGTTSSGMYLSTDGGLSWSATNTSSQLKGANCLTQDRRANHQNTWYYAGGNPWSSAGGGGSAYFLGDGIFKSIDSGLTWQAVASTAAASINSFTSSWQLVYSIAVDLSAPDSVEEIYAANFGTIQRSLNGGTTWATVRTGNSYFCEVAATTTGIIYATLSDDGTQKGIWRSTNGTAYTKIQPPTFPTAYNRIVMGINPNNENEVYFLANTPGFGKEVFDFLGTPHYNSLWKYTYLSGNGDSLGGTWQDLSINLPATGGIFDKYHTQDSYDMFVKVKPGNSNIVFLGGTNLYRSTSAWQDSISTTFIGGYLQGSALPVIESYANHHPDQHHLEFLPSNSDIMINANDGGIFRTNDNLAQTIAWVPLNNGYLSTMFYTVAIDHGSANNNIICGGAQDNGTWYTNSNVSTAPWKRVHGGDGSYVAIADNEASYYFSIQNGMRLIKSTLDASGNQTAFTRIDPIGGKGYQWMNPYVLDPNNNNIMYLAGGKYLWRNDDLSAIPLNNLWDSISTNWVKYLDSVPTANSEITALAVCKVPANRVYYGTDKQKVYKVDNANIGTPTPVNITPTGTLFPTGGYVNNISADPLDGNKVFVIFSNYNTNSILYTTDGGLTWTKQGGNLDATNVASPSCRWASILHVSDGTVYLMATSAGLFATDTLMGANTVWVQQGVNTIGNVVCDMIETRAADGLVVVATHAIGMFSSYITSVSDIVSIKEIKESKTDFSLTNYPNPFSQSTTIEFTLEKNMKVNLVLLDDCGRIIETLINETMLEGKHSFLYDKKNIRAGVYYYSLTADGRRKTNKMFIVR